MVGIDFGRTRNRAESAAFPQRTATRVSSGRAGPDPGRGDDARIGVSRSSRTAANLGLWMKSPGRSERASASRCGCFSRWGIGNCLSLPWEEWDLGSVRRVGSPEPMARNGSSGLPP